LYEKSVQWSKLNLLNKAIYVGELNKRLIEWHRIGAYYTPKLTFCHGFSGKFWDVVHVILEFLR